MNIPINSNLSLCLYQGIQHLQLQEKKKNHRQTPVAGMCYQCKLTQAIFQQLQGQSLEHIWYSFHYLKLDLKNETEKE